MGLYREQILPRLMDRLLATSEIMNYRLMTTCGLHGRVVEIGFGSGLNVETYPSDVTHVYAVDPAVVGRRLAADRVAGSHVEVSHVGLDGAALPLDDESCDAALSTFTLCTVADVDAAAREVFRVLKPGGRFHVLEHGRARDARVARRQHLLTPIQRRLVDGCHLNRDHWRHLTSAGFHLNDQHEWYASGPKPFAALYRGTVVKPAYWFKP